MCFTIRDIFYNIILLTLLNYSTSDDDIHIEKNYILIKDNSSSFQQTVDISSLSASDMSVCPDTSDFFCVKWGNYSLFNVSKADPCKDFEYKSTTHEQLKVTFYTHNIHMYGGAEQDLQTWPIESSNYNMTPYVSSQINSQGVLEPFWLFSTGQYLYVFKDIPLFINMNKTANIFEIIAQNQPPYLPNKTTRLKYRICKFANMKLAYLHAAKNVLGTPTKIPDTVAIQKPIWSTWVKYKSNISEKIITDFVNDTLSNGFSISHVEIDDKWETCYGSLIVDRSRFPDMKKLVQELKQKRINTTLWVHPFINTDCQPYYDEASSNGYFVKNSTGTATNWWNGVGGYIDFTNVNASEWFKKRLKKLLDDTGVQSFKFDAGESGWAPKNPIFTVTKDDYPETNLKCYVNMTSSFGNMVEVRVGRGTQKYPVFVRMLDRNSEWDGPLGLSTLIPTLLQMNIVGYPFVLPDMIGGNAYNGEVVEPELFIRWLQANVFMPTLQFSVPPWQFKRKDITSIAKKMIKIHKSFSNDIMHAMKEATKSGTPVNLPLWWIDPNDTETYTINTQFTLGEKVIVAPILTKGATTRDIYLPKGVWRDENAPKKSKLIMGPKWLRNYKADYDTLPYFTSANVRSDAAFLSSSFAMIFIYFCSYFINVFLYF